MRKNRNLLFLLIAFLLAFILSACGGVEEHIWLKSLGWSRAVFLGSTAYNDPVPIVVNEAGEQIFLLVEKDENTGVSHFRLRAFSSDAELIWESLLEDISLQYPENAQLMWMDGELHLFWIDQQQLYTASVDSHGSLLGAPLLLSDTDVVDSFSLVADSTGDATLLYAGTRETPGLYVLPAIDGSKPKVALDPAGIRIQARYDQNDQLYLSWAHYPMGYGTSELLYASYPADVVWEAAQATVLQEIATGPTNVFAGPFLGVDEQDVYLFWTVAIRTGLEAGTVQTEYLTFPHGDPGAAGRPQRLLMPALSTSMEQEAFPTEQLLVGERVALRGGLPLTPDVQELTANVAVAGELAIAFQTPTQHLWRKSKYQVNLAYFSDGVSTSYQPLSYTTTFSTTPYVISDTDNHLYITWLEKKESDWYTVYFASTAPEIVTALGHSSSGEILRVVGQVSFGMLVGVLMAPIAGAVWMLAPMFILLLTAPLRKLGSKRLQLVAAVVSIVLAIAAYWAGKFAVLPGMSTYVPFSAWVPEISIGVANFLRWAVPLFFSVVALAVAWNYTFRQSNESTLYFLLIYIGVDALLTSSVYAVLIFGGI